MGFSERTERVRRARSLRWGTRSADDAIAFRLPTTFRGGVSLERALLRGARGRIALRQRLCGSDERVIVTHSAGLVALVEVKCGRLTLLGPGCALTAPRCFVMVVPQRSLLRLRFEQAEVESDGLGVFSPIGGAPAIRHAEPGLPLELEGLLARELLAELPCDAGVEPSIARARALLHQRLGALAPVRRAAAGIALSPDSLTRAFSKAYNISPKRYCTRARLFDAVLSLLSGVDIAQSAYQAQFGDLSRFYKQFRRVLATTPGVYLRAGKRQDAARERR